MLGHAAPRFSATVVPVKSSKVLRYDAFDRYCSINAALVATAAVEPLPAARLCSRATPDAFGRLIWAACSLP